MTAGRAVVLVILDGWGQRADLYGNAIAQAATPNLDALTQRWPHTTLEASGESVGLPDGQQGNSEVGHLTIGSGRVVYQPLTRINKAIRTGEFFDNPVLIDAMDAAVARDAAVHCIGLVSPGGVHSHQDHGIALADLAQRRGASRVHFHLMTDGRDEPPSSAREFVARFLAGLTRVGAATVATMCGRYYGMDRDQRWERLERAYEVLVGGGAVTEEGPLRYIDAQYAKGITDEFIEPVRFGAAAPAIRDGDTVILWNFRPDRMRELTHALLDDAFAGFSRGVRPHDLAAITFTEYEKGIPAAIAFPREDVTDVLAEVVSRAGLPQFHVTETEKYAHVTYFINGGREAAFPGEERMLIPSKKVATYDMTPEMSAAEITMAVEERLSTAGDALIVVNFANADMVGHTGIFDATVDAVAHVDACIGRVVAAAELADAAVIITADHGNAELKIEATSGLPLTAHTTSPVPVILCNSGVSGLRPGGGLADVAPTVLAVMGLPVPEAMTGHSLVAMDGGPAEGERPVADAVDHV